MVRTPLCSSCQYDFFISSPSRVLILNMLFSFHLSPRVSAPLLNKVSMGVIGLKFAWTNRTGCCLSMAPALSRWFSYVCVCVCLSLSHWRRDCLRADFPLWPSYFQATSHTHTFLHAHKCAWCINAFGNISVLAPAPAKDYSICNSPFQP